MALWRKIFGFIVVCALLFFVSLVVFLKFQGKALMERKLGSLFHGSVTVGAVGYEFPFGINTTDLNVDGLLFSPDAHVRGDLNLFSVNRWGIKEVELDEAVLTLHPDPQGVLDWHPNSSSGAKPDAQVRSVPALPSGVIKKLVVTRGRIGFPSHNADEAMRVSLTDVELTAFNISLGSGDSRVPFTMIGRILDGEAFSGPNQFQATGWVNWQKRDLLASAHVAELRGNMDVSLQARSQSNQLTVTGNIKAKPSENSPGSEAKDALSVIFQQAQMAVDLTFSFNTLLDHWELRNIDFSGNLSPSVAARPAAE
ncbi:MAG: hypothetical protein JNN05_07155 [Candidatus Omnitrophica bacterium]|nr:hypothetical protein [Candidatus Omnitrophota bacterium]